MTTWFLCPYDVVMDPTLMRRCAMWRYIPIQNNADGDKWEEVEIRGNYTMVKVSATDATLAAIRADPDFTEILTKEPLTKATTDVFKTLGYAPEELTATTPDDLLRVVCATRSEIEANATKDDIVVTAVVLLNDTKTFDTVDVKVADVVVP